MTTQELLKEVSQGLFISRQVPHSTIGITGSLI